MSRTMAIRTRISEAREFLAYDAWANKRMLLGADALTPGQLLESAEGAPSIREMLGHIIAAEWIWVRRWHGENPQAPPSWAKESSLADLRKHQDTLNEERAVFLERLSEEDLDRSIAYKTSSGRACADSLGDLIRQMVNHSTYHRGQLAARMRQLGHIPPATDLLLFLWERQ